MLKLVKSIVTESEYNPISLILLLYPNFDLDCYKEGFENVEKKHVNSFQRPAHWEKQEQLTSNCNWKYKTLQVNWTILMRNHLHYAVFL